MFSNDLTVGVAQGHLWEVVEHIYDEPGGTPAWQRLIPRVHLPQCSWWVLYQHGPTSWGIKATTVERSLRGWAAVVATTYPRLDVVLHVNGTLTGEWHLGVNLTTP